MSYIVILAILDQNLFLILAIFITIRILSQYQNSKLALAATLALMLILAHFGIAGISLISAPRVKNFFLVNKQPKGS